MVDFASDQDVETYKKAQIKRKPVDPYGGPIQYYAVYGDGTRTANYDDLQELRRYLNGVFNENVARGIWADE